MRAAAVLVLLALATAPVAAVAQPAPARIVAVQVTGSAVRITIDRGSKQGVATGWLGHLIGKGGLPIPHSEFTVRSVTRDTCQGDVKLTYDQVSAEGVRVELEEPPDPPRRR
jgi:hypothetical protein